MKIFSIDKFTDILNMDGWTHEDYFVDYEKEGYGSGVVGTSSKIKYDDQTLKLTIFMPWGPDEVYPNEIEFEKNFIVYDEEDEFDLETFFSFEEPNEFEKFVQYNQKMVDEVAAERIAEYREILERQRAEERRSAFRNEIKN